MTAFRRTLMVFAIVNVLFAFFTAAVGLFADGGDLWSSLVLTGLHPLSAIAVILLVYIPRPKTTLVFSVMAILAIDIIADITLANFIAAGTVKGDWQLPLVFSVVPTLAIVYAVCLLFKRKSAANADSLAD